MHSASAMRLESGEMSDNRSPTAECKPVRCSIHACTEPDVCSKAAEFDFHTD
jgi:hypothetical protein